MRKKYFIEKRPYGATHQFIVHEHEIDKNTPVYFEGLECTEYENCKNNVAQQLTEVTKREAISLDCARAASDGDTGNSAEPFPKVITVKGEQYRHRSELDRWMEENAQQARRISALMQLLKEMDEGAQETCICLLCNSHYKKIAALKGDGK